MASQDHIRNPIEWGWDQVTLATLTVGSLGRSLGGSELGQRSRRFRSVSDRRFLPLHHLPARRHRALIIVMPVLGHATWHLYRKVVEPSTSQSVLASVPN